MSYTDDPDLLSLLPSIGPYHLFDAAILEFDFTSLVDTIKFRYVFASEEYPTYVCSQYNDVFGFFITGPDPGGGTYTGKNIALIPGTSLPVAINTINSGTPGGSYSAADCQSLSYNSFFKSNIPWMYNFIYDGFTTILTVVCPVVKCQEYHIKLAITDAGDQSYDSGIFLEKNSFDIGSFIVTASPDTVCAGTTSALTASGGTSYS